MKPIFRDIRDLALIMVVAAIVLGCGMHWADAAQVCRTGTCGPQAVVSAVSQPLAYSTAVLQPYYLVGQQIREEAAATAEFRASAEYQELQELRAWKAGFDAARQTVAPAGAEQQAEPPAAPSPPPASSVIVQRCAKCHGGEDPKGGLWLDGTVDLRGEDAAAKRDAIMQQVWRGHMPPKTPLTDAETASVIQELYGQADQEQSPAIIPE